MSNSLLISNVEGVFEIGCGTALAFALLQFFSDRHFVSLTRRLQQAEGRITFMKEGAKRTLVQDKYAMAALKISLSELQAVGRMSVLQLLGVLMFLANFFAYLTCIEFGTWYVHKGLFYILAVLVACGPLWVGLVQMIMAQNSTASARESLCSLESALTAD